MSKQQQYVNPHPQAESRELTEKDFSAYSQFLIEVLEATNKSDVDARVVYPLLVANTDKLDGNFANVLRRWTTAKFEKLEANVAEYMAVVTGNFGYLIERFSFGDKASNMEIAIACYESILKVFTRQALPQRWAQAQNNLGNAYKSRILGSKAENIEIAIKFYQAALQVHTRQAFPYEWAQAQYNLGNAYQDRIIGNKAENIETAINFYQATSQVRTRQAFPQKWAQTQNNLGNAYRSRILGDKAENIEIAISFFHMALEVRASQDFPYEWAQTQQNLGIAYRNRILGDKAENIENAIKAYLCALEVRTYQDFSFEWAMTQNNLGLAYRDKILGSKTVNIKNAISSLEDALKVYTRQAFPQDWARTQHNLGLAYLDLTNEDLANNIENAIKVCKAALQVYTRQSFPYEWAITQNILGIAYRDRILGDKAKNIENAVKAYQAALQILTIQAFPQDWAATQNNLGAVYTFRDTENAIKAYQAALQVYTHQALPHHRAETLLNLGIAYQYTGRFNSAYSSYKSVIDTVELLRGEIISGEESKRKQAEYFNKAYGQMVEVCLELGEDIQAIEYIERSKTRNLVELILERDSNIIFPPEVVIQLEQLRDEIAKEQYKIQNSTAENPKALAEHLQELRQRKNNLQDNYLPVGSGFDFETLQTTLDKNITIIEWYITSSGWETFVISSDRVQRFNSPKINDDFEALADLVNEYWNIYGINKNEWINTLAVRLNHFAQILKMEDILKLIPRNCSRLILIPHLWLHLFPLHALPLNNGELLYERFPDGVSYAPSLQILQQIQKRKRPDFQNLFAIQNPTEDLYYTDLEVDSILNIFPTHQVLAHNQATKDKLVENFPSIQEANYLHFCCHGLFNLNTPQDSCLLLAESIDEQNHLDLSKCFTLGNLFEQDFQLNNCRLVVLSACETGLVDFNNTSDEYISLPSGFLYAGATSVVSSLWTVDDLSTSLLMITFLQNFQNQTAKDENSSAAIALNQAQTWIKNVTKEELAAWMSNLPLDKTWKMHINRFVNSLKTRSKPFESPFYWAGFIAIGK